MPPIIHISNQLQKNIKKYFNSEKFLLLGIPVNSGCCIQGTFKKLKLMWLEFFVRFLGPFVVTVNVPMDYALHSHPVDKILF